jgi:hypothetical protein
MTLDEIVAIVVLLALIPVAIIQWGGLILMIIDKIRIGEVETMAKNLIPGICKMLGVELGEEFKVEGDGRTYWLDLDGLHTGSNLARGENDVILRALLCGETELVKLPWKPESGEEYYTFELIYGKWVVCTYRWLRSPRDYALFDKGWVYKTCKEAADALPDVAKELGVGYKL